MSYTNRRNEVIFDSPGNYFELVDCYSKPSSTATEEKIKVEAAAIERRASDLRSQLSELRPQEPPNEILLSSVPPEILVTGSLKMFQDP